MVGLERLPVAPTALVIFGATGDLARRKLLPALYNLAHDGALPGHFHLVGVSRREMSHQEYREECDQAIRRFSRRPPDEDVLRELLSEVRYVAGVFDDDSVYPRLGRILNHFDKQAGEPLNRAFYLATAPSFFPLIVERLGEHHLNAHEGAEVRVIIEKPFGASLAEAQELNRRVLSVFDESQVFRIDHYLGKETVQNMLAFRFANGMFEPLWNRNYIDHVQITAAEDIGIGRRAGYYDHAGALRDLIQNHMLQLLCNVAMEPPVNFGAEEVRNEKVKVLQSIHLPTVADAPAIAVRGQYVAGHVGGEEVPGYLEEPGVREGSHDGDLRGPAPAGRQLALGWCSISAAGRQASGAPGDRDRDQAEARPASRLQPGRVARDQAEPAHPHGPAQRGRVAAARRKDSGNAHEDPLGEHGVPLRHGLSLAVAGGLRAPDRGRDARGRDAVHTRRRGRGPVAHLRADHRRLGSLAGPAAALRGGFPRTAGGRGAPR